jgi:hypothetical protein
MFANLDLIRNNYVTINGEKNVKYICPGFLFSLCKLKDESSEHFTMPYMCSKVVRLKRYNTIFVIKPRRNARLSVYFSLWLSVMGSRNYKIFIFTSPHGYKTAISFAIQNKNKKTCFLLNHNFMRHFIYPRLIKTQKLP